jgi:hypothetical protein
MTDSDHRVHVLHAQIDVADHATCRVYITLFSTVSYGRFRCGVCEIVGCIVNFSAPKDRKLDGTCTI